ncbi:MAG: hypothetical protein AAF573_14555 [Bacteroidota bacterium]
MKTRTLNFNVIKDSLLGLITQQKNQVEAHHQKLLKQAEALGKQDGSLNLPRVEDPQLSPHEGMLKHEYQKLIAELWKKGKPYLDGPHLEYHTQADKIEEMESNEKVLLQKESDLLEKEKVEGDRFLEKEFDIAKFELEEHEKAMKHNYLVAKKELEEVQVRTGRMTPIIHFKSTILYALLLIGIGLAEVPLNLQIFQKFGEAFFITIIMASSLAIAVPVLAHFAGVFLKQRKEKAEFLFFCIASVLLFMIFNFGVSIFRAYVLAENIGEESSYVNIVIFTCLNLILFFIGVLAAYFRHDESYELEHAHARFVKEKKAYDKKRGKIQNRRKALEANRNARLRERNEQYLSTKKSILTKMTNQQERATAVSKRNSAAKVYDELLNAFVALEAMVDAGYKTSIAKYRAVNLMHRENHLSPESWSNGITDLELRFEQKTELDPN